MDILSDIWQKIIDWRRGYGLLGAQRSAKWGQVRREFLKRNPKCIACDSSKDLIVHHKKPFHIFPELELLENNFVTLCEGKTVNCHYLFGHCLKNWKCYNVNVEEDIKIIARLRKNALENLSK